jgi:hypothetical protein
MTSGPCTLIGVVNVSGNRVGVVIISQKKK